MVKLPSSFRQLSRRRQIGVAVGCVGVGVAGVLFALDAFGAKGGSRTPMVSAYLDAALVADGEGASTAACPSSQRYVQSDRWVEDVTLVLRRANNPDGYVFRRGTDDVSVFDLIDPDGSRLLSRLVVRSASGDVCIVVPDGASLGEIEWDRQ